MENIPFNIEQNPNTQLKLNQQKKQQAKRRNRVIIITVLLLLFALVIAGGIKPSLFNGFFSKAPLIPISQVNTPTAPKIAKPNTPNKPIVDNPDNNIQTPDIQITVDKPISPEPPKKLAQKTKSIPPTKTPTITIPNQPSLPVPLSINSTLIKCNATCANINTVITAGNNTILSNGIVYATTPNPTLANTIISSSDFDGNFNTTFSDMQIVNNYYVRSYVTTNSGTIYSNQISIINTLSTTHNTEPSNIMEIFRNLAGNGTADNPYIITNDWELQAMSQDLGAAYKLGNNIDASGTETWNIGRGFTPIGGDGYNDQPFTGNFDGNGYGILGLTINREGSAFNQGFNYYVGLFSRTNNAKIYDIVLQDNYILAKHYVGGIVGYADGTTEIRNAVVEGVSWARYGLYGGGLIGWMENGLIDNSLTTGQVHGSGSIIGGLVGYMNNGTISNSTARSDVDGGAVVGGLVGQMQDGEIINSCANGNVDVVYEFGIGKLGGTGGGFVAYMFGGSIKNSHATGNVNVDEYGAGGFVAYMFDNSSIISSYATGNVTAKSESGGFVGYIRTTIPSVSPDSISVIKADSSSPTTPPAEVGIHNSYSTGNIIFPNFELLAAADNTLDSFGYSSIGGFVGTNVDASIIKNTYSTGKVISENPLVVSPTNKGFAGELVFYNSSSEALALNNTDNYWDTDASLQTSSADNAAPLITSQMYQPNNFNTWNFDTVWKTDGVSYPVLRNNANCVFSCFKENPELPATNPFIFPVAPMDCITPPISNNLLVYLDVCKTSYPGYGTVWNDLGLNNFDAILGGEPIVYNASDGGNVIFNNNQNFTITPPSSQSLSNYTYNTWIKPLQLDIGNINYIYSLGSNDGMDSFYSNVYLDNNTIILDGSSSVYNELISDYDYENYSYNTGINVDPDKWYNIAVTHSNNDTIKLYINGVFVYETPTINTYRLNPTQFFIGNGYQGAISHASIYDRALDQTELQQFFDTTKSRFSVIGN